MDSSGSEGKCSPRPLSESTKNRLDSHLISVCDFLQDSDEKKFLGVPGKTP